jgi:hypothetical protein
MRRPIYKGLAAWVAAGQSLTSLDKEAEGVADLMDAAKAVVDRGFHGHPVSSEQWTALHKAVWRAFHWEQYKICDAEPSAEPNKV